MAELVDASDSKSDSARSAGSIPARGTNFGSRRLENGLRLLQSKFPIVLDFAERPAPILNLDA